MSEAVKLARVVVDRYGADADKPSVHLAKVVIAWAHERDIHLAEIQRLDLLVAELRDKLAEATTKLAYTMTERTHLREERDGYRNHIEKRRGAPLDAPRLDEIAETPPLAHEECIRREALRKSDYEETIEMYREQRDEARRQSLTAREAAAIRWLACVAESAGDGEHDDAIASLLDKAKYARSDRP